MALVRLSDLQRALEVIDNLIMKSKIYTLAITFFFGMRIFADDKIAKDDKSSPSVNYLFHTGFHSAGGALSKVKTEQELQKQLSVARQSYLLCYAYWYSINIEKTELIDENIENLLVVLLFQLDKRNFDIRNDLSLIRRNENMPLSKQELNFLYRASGFPCSRSHFTSDKMYEKLADEFTEWVNKKVNKQNKKDK